MAFLCRIVGHRYCVERVRFIGNQVGVANKVSCARCGREW